MNHRLTFRQYRQMDLTVFGAMLVVAEALIVLAATRWFPAEAYTVSIVAAVTSIVLMRWGPWAAIHAVLGGLVYCFVSGGQPGQYLIYCAGNLFALLSLLWFRIPGKDRTSGSDRISGKERIREDSFLTVIFGLTVQLLMQLGRAAVAFALLRASPGSAPAGTQSIAGALSFCIGFITTDALSGFFTAVILWIARRQDGLFEDQKHYLLRIQEAEKEERGEI
ncbi:MAG: hypothetical protein IKH70_00550 [Stomatobaculum sp.]|nr:hypothetical protein [Stomatobaculum sp.]